MKNFTMVILAGALMISFAYPVQAGMNHQPHSVKTFMGKERKVLPASQQNQSGKTQTKSHIKPYSKKK